MSVDALRAWRIGHCPWNPPDYTLKLKIGQRRGQLACFESLYRKLSGPGRIIGRWALLWPRFHLHDAGLLVDHSHLVGGDDDRTKDDQIETDGVARSHVDDGASQDSEDDSQAVADDDGLFDAEPTGHELVMEMMP